MFTKNIFLVIWFNKQLLIKDKTLANINPPLRNFFLNESNIQGVFEMRAQILITSYWLHVELGKISKKFRQKIK
jgi:hypothetical protein